MKDASLSPWISLIIISCCFSHFFCTKHSFETIFSMIKVEKLWIHLNHNSVFKQFVSLSDLLYSLIWFSNSAIQWAPFHSLHMWDICILQPCSRNQHFQNETCLEQPNTLWLYLRWKHLQISYGWQVKKTKRYNLLLI